MTRDYPPAPVADQVDDYHGTPVPDPYRPLETADAPATRRWVEAQNRLTAAVLDAYPHRAGIRDRLAALWDFPRGGAPWRQGDRWFQMRNTGLQEQDVLWTAEAPDATGAVVLDPNGLGRDGTTTLAAVSVAHGGGLVACALSEAGSDWQTWTVRDVATGEPLDDRVPWSKFTSAAWTHDDAGFFYGRYPEPPPGAAHDAPNHDMELRYHRVGSAPDADLLVFSTPHEPEWGFGPEVSEDGRHLVLTVWRGTDPETRIFVADLAGGVESAVVRPLLDAADAHYHHVATVAGTVYLQTDLDAPMGRVIAVSATDAADRREVVAETADALEHVRLVGGRFASVYLRDASHRLVLLERDGRPAREVALPGLGTIGDLSGRLGDDRLFVTFETFASPPVVLGVAMATGEVRPSARPDLAWDPDAYETELAFVTSGDGTRVPLFLSRRRDVVASGDVRTLLYGYGGFSVAIGPMFRAEWLAWMERGGLLAVASLRGGSEYGTAWHDAGRLANKQHVFDDFAACLRWLAASGWTRAERIGILGRSNGGLLVGATVTQHPELLGAAVAEVGVLDMLRFHRFTIGWGWTSDYGSSEDPEQFRTLLAYSPLHNVRRGVAYPPVLVTTGDHDDRVVPGHSYKFAAALQAAQAGEAPILLRVDTDAGHGAGKPVGKLVDERADVLAFLEQALDSRG